MSHHDAYEAPLLYDLDQRTASLEQFAQRYPQAWELLNHSIGELRVVQNIWPAHNAEATPVELKCFALWFRPCRSNGTISVAKPISVPTCSATQQQGPSQLWGHSSIGHIVHAKS